MSLWDEARAAGVLLRTGFAPRTRPDHLAAFLLEMRRYGPGAAICTVGALRFGERTAIIDERGSVTYAELHLRSNSLANAWAAAGIEAGARIGVLCRDHRGLLESTFAAWKLGATAVMLNPGFSAPQLVDVADREDLVAVVFDAEFAEAVSALPPVRRYVAWQGLPETESIDALIDATPATDPPAPVRRGGVVVLTSGTTGTPKGARRAQPTRLADLAAIPQRIPLRPSEVTLVAAPLFHSWGLMLAVLTLASGSTLVLRMRFDPAATVRALAEHRCAALVVVPLMLRRILDLGDEEFAGLDLSALRIVASSGSALPVSTVTRARQRFGEVVYNLYGSTEVAWAALATPADLREAPASVGRPLLGTTVRLYDAAGRRITKPDEPGRIFVGSGMRYDGYTGGGSKQVIDGLMSTGDVGHVDAAGRLFVDGREDDMIVSGAENVFPREVEDLLNAHPAIADAAVVGVADEEWGQRLAAYVVVRSGGSITADEVRDHVRSNLARHKVPRDVVFLDALPRTETGKVITAQLRDSG